MPPMSAPAASPGRSRPINRNSPFRGATRVTLGCLAVALAYGWLTAGGLLGALRVGAVVSLLAVLEVSFSFENAVVNAAVLSGMSALWRRRFLTWGLAFSVVGVRIALPIIIVAVAAGLGPVAALRLSLMQPARYAALLQAGHAPIAGFGGAFLLLVGLKFFLAPAKQVHWLPVAERALQRLGRWRLAAVALVLALVLGLAVALPGAERLRFGLAGVLGIAAFLGMEALGAALARGRMAAVSSGLGAFLYLNLLDTSFSLDGVIGAFAVSDQLVAIALGLTIGAVFVRALTVVLVEKGTLTRFRFLEHGAFWAIVALGGLMLASARVAVPQAVAGLSGAALIGAALWSSARRRA